MPQYGLAGPSNIGSMFVSSPERLIDKRLNTSESRRGERLCAKPYGRVAHSSLAALLALAYNSPGMAVAEKRSDPPDRPRSVTFVAWGVLILGAANLWRAFGFARQSDLYQLLGIKPDSTILLALALIWALALIAASLAIWHRWPPIRIVLPVLIGSYGLYQLGIQAVFTRSEIALQGRAAFALVYGAAVLASLWALNRRAGQRYLIGEEEE